MSGIAFFYQFTTNDATNFGQMVILSEQNQCKKWDLTYKNKVYWAGISQNLS